MKRALLVIAFLSLIGCVAWSAFALIDAGISIDHARRMYGFQHEDITQLRSMLRHTTLGLSHTDLLKILADDLKSQPVVKEEEQRIAIGSVIFYFKEDKVSDVRILSEDPDY